MGKTKGKNTSINLDKNVIICGDTIEELKKLPSESVDLIFADPPYWLRINGTLHRVEGTEYDGCDDEWDNQFTSLADYENFTEKWLSECKRILKKDGSIWVIGGMQCIYTIGAIMQRLGFWFINDVIWYKKNPTPNFRGTRLNNSHETLIWATKSEKSKYTFNYKTAKELNMDTVTEEEFRKGVRKQLGSVWRIGVCQGNERLKDEDGKKLHSTQKPEELLYRIIAISSKLGDTVLDPFGGTMTTAAVAKRMGRNYIMIERNKKYCKYGEIRVNSVKPQISDIEQAVFDRKEIRVSMDEMIQNGYFKTGEYFYLKDKSKCAILKSNGKLELDGKEMDMHTAAAIAVNSKATRLNGYKYWYVIRDNNLKSIDDVRAEYRNYIKNTRLAE
jgi:site-specific DNA-methyltransferase (adenine-specific)